VTHRIRLARDDELTDNMTGNIDPDYQRRLDEQIESREKAHGAALRALEAAERAAQQATRAVRAATTARDKKHRASKEAVAWAHVQLRREELERIQRIMSTSPAAARYRGTSSYRPVPVRQGAAF
jgi:hypothetical protein